MCQKAQDKEFKVKRVLWKFLFLPIFLGVFFHFTSSLANPEEEITNLPQFSGTTLAKNGNLILAEGNTTGIYISKLIPTSFQTRIMIPSFTIAGSSRPLRGVLKVRGGEAISFDISADDGINYKTNCRSGSYYYASRGDFTPGSNLRYCIRFSKGKRQRPNIHQGLGLQVEEVNLDYRPGSIFLVSPNGGELWPAGRRQKILWRASDYERTYLMRIEYSLDRGKTYKAIKEKSKNTGAYSWRIPRKLSGKKVLIKVSDALDENIYDTSDGTLEIR